MEQIDPWPNNRKPIDYYPPEIQTEKFENARNAGRESFWKYALVRVLVLDIVRQVAATVSTTYRGANPEWGILATEFLRANDRLADYRGSQYSMARLRSEYVWHIVNDGDAAILKTIDGETGLPRLQLIHSDYIGEVVKNPWGKLLGYKVGDRMIPARALCLRWYPGYGLGGRGVSPIGIARWHWQDLGEIKSNERIAARALSTKTFSVQTGSTADASDALFSSSAAQPDNDDFRQLGDVTYEELEPGRVDYVRSSGEIKPFTWGARPNGDLQTFISNEIVELFASMGWSAHIALDQTKLGSAGMRLVADRTRGTALELFSEFIAGPQREIDAFRLGAAVAQKILPEPPDVSDFFAFEYEGGREVTADRLYRARTDQLDLQSRFTTRETIQATRGAGQPWEATQEQLEREEQRILVGNERLDLAKTDAAARVYDYAKRLAGDDAEKLKTILEGIK